MRKQPTNVLQLFPKGSSIYKANLHTHTNISDGDWTPEEVKKLYKDQGYQIVAFTDHEIGVPHPELTDENFLALTGYEMSIDLDLSSPRGDYLQNYHFCLISKAAHNIKNICYDQRCVDIYVGKCGNPFHHFPYEIFRCGVREHTVDFANRTLQEAAEAGYLVTYNHPAWSLHNYSDYSGLKGLWGVEVFNTGSVAAGYDDDQPHVYEDLLRCGVQVFPVAADDMHKERDLFGGWVMIAADSLDYETVIAALESGDLYASTGPALYSLKLENGILKVCCSGCRCIRVGTEFRFAIRQDAQPDELLTEAEFDLRSWFSACTGGNEANAYFRVTLEDADGKRAYSRAFFRTEVETQFVSR